MVLTSCLLNYLRAGYSTQVCTRPTLCGPSQLCSLCGPAPLCADWAHSVWNWPTLCGTGLGSLCGMGQNFHVYGTGSLYVEPTLSETGPTLCVTDPGSLCVERESGLLCVLQAQYPL